MGVLVGVNVGDSDAGLLELLDLRACLRLHLLLPDAAKKEISNKSAKRGTK